MGQSERERKKGGCGGREAGRTASDPLNPRGFLGHLKATSVTIYCSYYIYSFLIINISTDTNPTIIKDALLGKCSIRHSLGLNPLLELGTPWGR